VELTSKPEPTYVHTAIVVVKKRNMDLVNKILMDVSDPLSLNYGKHLTRAEVGEMTLNREATEFVKSYLSALQFQIVGETIYGDYITVSGTISAWESLLATKFFNFAVGDGEVG
jgi:tripeptidyl-peptidase-1